MVCPPCCHPCLFHRDGMHPECIVVVYHIPVAVVIEHHHGILELLHDFLSIHLEMSFLDFSKLCKSPICAHEHHYIVWLLECLDVEGNSIIGTLDCIHISNLLFIEVLDDLVSWDMLGPVASFLDESGTKSPFFFNSIIAFNTQNLLSRTNTLPVPQTAFVSCSNNPTVFPRLLYSFSPKSHPKDDLFLHKDQVTK